jgi:putative inorganic carbon (hco3(-)) transporter
VRLRPWAAGAWLVALAALALTQVRGAWLGFLVGVGLSLVVVRRRWAVLAAVAVIVVAATALPGVTARVRTIGSVADATTRDRLAMLTGGLRMVAEHPWTGVGPGQVKRLYPRYAPPEALRRSTSHLHDTPLQIAVERGLIGLGLWLTLFAGFFIRATGVLRRLPAEAEDDRALVAGVVAAVAAFLVAGLFEYNFGDTEVLLTACALMALPFVVEASRTSPPGA